MKRILTIITFFIMFLFQTLSSFAEPAKVMSLNYDDTSSLVYINIMTSSEETAKELKFSKLENPNRIYFDIDNSVLIGGKQQLVFDKAVIKEIRLSQFTTNPDVVRTVITFEEDFDKEVLNEAQAEEDEKLPSPEDLDINFLDAE